jgi:hypothetical protein
MAGFRGDKSGTDSGPGPDVQDALALGSGYFSEVQE